jgi:adenosine kinase
MRFLVNGSIAYDLLLSHEGSFLSGIDAKNLDKLSVNYVAQGFVRHHGGTAANIGWNLALLGHTPKLVGAVGFDGAEYLELLKERGVDVAWVDQKKDVITATAVIATDNGERQISFFHPGADSLGGLPKLSDDRDDIAYAIISPRNPVLMIKGAAQCAKEKIPYLFDPGQLVHAFSKADFQTAVKESVGLVCNEYEWGIASKVLGWKEADVLRECGMLVVTQGEKGIHIATKKETLDIPACKAELVNPTGAGDAVRAGLLIGLAQKWSLLHTGRLAAILGALVVEQEGTLLESLDWDMVQERAVENYSEQLPKV